MTTLIIVSESHHLMTVNPNRFSVPNAVNSLKPAPTHVILVSPDLMAFAEGPVNHIANNARSLNSTNMSAVLDQIRVPYLVDEVELKSQGMMLKS